MGLAQVRRLGLNIVFLGIPVYEGYSSHEPSDGRSPVRVIFRPRLGGVVTSSLLVLIVSCFSIKRATKRGRSHLFPEMSEWKTMMPYSFCGMGSVRSVGSVRSDPISPLRSDLAEGAAARPRGLHEHSIFSMA